MRKMLFPSQSTRKTRQTIPRTCTRSCFLVAISSSGSSNWIQMGIPGWFPTRSALLSAPNLYTFSQLNFRSVCSFENVSFRVLDFGKPQGGINRRPNARNNLSTRMAHNFCSMRSFFKRKNALDSPHSQLSNAVFLLKNDLNAQIL